VKGKEMQMRGAVIVELKEMMIYLRICSDWWEMMVSG